ncbi:epoxyqueuosine reductase QueH [Candidatus Woesearchaeota archaeon]|nr:epoxyqueuosine reductase QueH [Candidatus Woesearchaeota archaeon]
MKRLLLHVCCAPCSTSVIEKLKENYDVTLFFYNPNVEPINEYEKRLNEAERYAEAMDIPIIIGDYDIIDWQSAVRGHENDPEGGERCAICFRFRLQKTAQVAKEGTHQTKEGDSSPSFDLFTTTLTVSPYKNAEIINQIGKEFDNFLEQDFKKDYMHSIELSKKYNLYRQNYCGCLFSKK